MWEEKNNKKNHKKVHGSQKVDYELIPVTNEKYINPGDTLMASPPSRKPQVSVTSHEFKDHQRKEETYLCKTKI